MNTEARIENYLEALTAHLRSLTSGEREEIVGKIAARIRNSTGEPDPSVDVVLARLGPPERLATQYQDARMIEKASQSLWPPILLRAILRAGAVGILVFLGGVAGYWLGGSMVVFGILALIWSLVGPSSASATPVGSSLVTGLEPIVLGCLIVLGTTFVLRALLRALQRGKPPL